VARNHDKGLSTEGAILTGQDTDTIVQIMTAPFDLFNEFELNATCFQVRDVNHPGSIALG
jgi:hypothetical protein